MFKAEADGNVGASRELSERGQNIGVITIDGRRGTGKTQLALNICREYGSGLLELGPLFRLVAWMLNSHPEMNMSDAVSEIMSLVRDSRVVFGSADESSPCGARITWKSQDITMTLWRPELDGILKALSNSVEVVKQMRSLVSSLELSKSLVVVGREASTEFFPSAGLKLVLVAHDRIRKARKQNQLSGIIGVGNAFAVDLAEPGVPNSSGAEAFVIDTTDLTPSEVFAKSSDIIGKRLAWRRVAHRRITASI